VNVNLMAGSKKGALAEKNGMYIRGWNPGSRGLMYELHAMSCRLTLMRKLTSAGYVQLISLVSSLHIPARSAGLMHM
jgi:hypothetical protein